MSWIESDPNGAAGKQIIKKNFDWIPHWVIQDTSRSFNHCFTKSTNKTRDCLELKRWGRGCSWKEAFAVRMLNMKLVTMAKVWKLKMKVETYCLFQICVPTIRMPRMFSTSSFNGYRNNRLQIIEFRYFTLKVLNSKMKSLSKLEQWIMNIFSLRSNLNFKKRLAIELELQIGKL